MKKKLSPSSAKQTSTWFGFSIGGDWHACVWSACPCIISWLSCLTVWLCCSSNCDSGYCGSVQRSIWLKSGLPSEAWICQNILVIWRVTKRVMVWNCGFSLWPLITPSMWSWMTVFLTGINSVDFDYPTVILLPSCEASLCELDV